jgi:Mg2+/Co2+ transporter CorB
MIEMSTIFVLIFLLVLLGFSAFFSGSETALMAISRLRLRHLAETNPVRARLVERILKRPERLIGTILLGNNLANVAMSAIATALAISFWGHRGIAYVTIVLTITILIFAEITPKVYAKYFNERISFLIAPVLNVIMAIFNPVIIVATYITNKILFLTGVDVTKIKGPLLTEEEIMTYIKIGWGDGAITTEERKMLSRVFTLNDKSIREVMVPKEKMTALDIDASIEYIVKIILKTGYSRFPITKGKNLDIAGIIHTKDFFRLIDAKKSLSINKILRPPYFVEADKKIDEQLRSFQAKRLHQAIVLDNTGNVIGLVTLEDILEELVGSIQDEHDMA